MKLEHKLDDGRIVFIEIPDSEIESKTYWFWRNTNVIALTFLGTEIFEKEVAKYEKNCSV